MWTANLVSAGRRVLRDGGFTFQEVLVAMNLIVAIMLGYSVLAIEVTRGASSTANQTVAIHLAQDKIEELRSRRTITKVNTCPDAGERSITATGSAGGIFDRCWTVADSALGDRLLELIVKVSWSDHEKREVMLTTLRYED